MRTIIAGSRDIVDAGLVARAIEAAGWTPTIVLCGCARGVDDLGAAWARLRKTPVETYPADWQTYGRAAGPRRNAEMVARAEALIVVRYPDSRGSADVLARARWAGLRVHDVVVPRVADAERRGE